MRSRSYVGWAWLWMTGAFLSGACYSQEPDHTKNFDQYTVYYNLINSTFLTPEVAERYEISRDDDVAVLTVSVRGPNEDGEMTAQPSEISGVVTDLVQRRALEFDEFRDPNAVYYIAEVQALGRTRLDFSLDISPKGSAEVYQLEFSEMLYPPVNP